MIKCRVHIRNRSRLIDNEVYVDIQLSIAPRNREVVLLEKSHTDELKKKIKSAKLTDVYFPCMTNSEIHAHEFGIYVVDAIHVPGEDFVHVELDEG